MTAVDAALPDDPAGKVAAPGEPVPHPGSQQMPRWNRGELYEAPWFTWRNWFALLGPGLVMGGAAIGGGEWLVGPLVTAKYGGALLWLATLSIVGQVIYNIEVSRYALYCGEPIFTGKLRTLPGPVFWLTVYLVLDFGSVFPYLAANAATPLEVMLLGGRMPDPDNIASDWWLHRGLSTGIFVLALVPLMFGGKIYNSLKAVMTFKIFFVFGFLLILAVLYSHPGTWSEIFSGFFKVGTLPVQRDEDLNGNGVLDAGEDWDSDGHLDVVEPEVVTAGGETTFHDVDGDGKRDGDNVQNIFVSLFRDGRLPDIDFTLIGFIAALAAIAGSGGLTNSVTSNYTRDQGWGMGRHVGAIPSVVGGQKIKLSHVGTVFEPTAKSLPRWKRWYRHVLRDQLAVWLPACIIGVALPSMLSVEFLPRGTEANNWTAAAMTAEGVGDRIANPPSDVLASTTGLSSVIAGEGWGRVFWATTLFCGFMVLGPSMAVTADGVIRRWVDVIWTALPGLRAMEAGRIRYVYFYVLAGYAAFGIVMLWLSEPLTLLKHAATIYNFALGFSCWHTLVINKVLLPKPLRTGWLMSLGLILAGVFFNLLAVVTLLKTLGVL